MASNALALLEGDTLRLRAGTLVGRIYQLEGEGAFLQPYLKINALHEFSLGGKIFGDGISRRPNLDGFGISIGAGLMWQVDSNNQFYLDYEAYQGQSWKTPWAINFGFRHQF